MPTSRVTKATPVLFVERVEPCVAFWTALGFEAVQTVPHGDRVGFAILSNGPVELMYQSHASLADDMPEAVPPGPSFLFVEVDDLTAAKNAVAGAPVFLPERRAPYGATEVGVLDPAGHRVVLARVGPA